METKRCRKCGEVKGVEEFPKDRRNRDGFSWRCSLCNREAVRNYIAANYEKTREAVKKWNSCNPERRREVLRRSTEKRHAVQGPINKARKFMKRVELSDGYVKTLLRGAVTSPELIEMKRQQLLAHRALKEFQKLLKEQTK